MFTVVVRLHYFCVLALAEFDFFLVWRIEWCLVSLRACTDDCPRVFYNSVPTSVLLCDSLCWSGMAL